MALKSCACRAGTVRFGVRGQLWHLQRLNALPAAVHSRGMEDVQDVLRLARFLFHLGRKPQRCLCHGTHVALGHRDAVVETVEDDLYEGGCWYHSARNFCSPRLLRAIK